MRARSSDAGPLDSRYGPQCELRAECETLATEECSAPRCRRLVCEAHGLRCGACGAWYCGSCVSYMGGPLDFVCDACMARARELEAA